MSFLHSFSVTWCLDILNCRSPFHAEDEVILFQVTAKPYMTLDHSKQSSGSCALYLSRAIFTLVTHSGKERGCGCGWFCPSTLKSFQVE